MNQLERDIFDDFIISFFFTPDLLDAPDFIRKSFIDTCRQAFPENERCRECAFPEPVGSYMSVNWLTANYIEG